MIKDVCFNECTDTIGRPCRFFLISTMAGDVQAGDSAFRRLELSHRRWILHGSLAPLAPPWRNPDALTGY